MGIKYQQNYQVPFYESDAFKKMRISSLLAVALQISGEQSTALGRSDVWVFERYGLFWAVIEYEGLLAKSPEPPSLQKIQPPVLILPSLLGHERPELIDNLYTLHPNLFLK